MNWIFRYQLFLFDFDGLLVDTERLHYQAYIETCKNRGFELTWTFEEYCAVAQQDATQLRARIYAEFPLLFAAEPNWAVLYDEKKQNLLRLVKQDQVPLLPGVATLLLALQQAGIHRCVVTHSPLSLINQIREKNPLLNTIPHWITREDYSHPKPHPECYQKAINLFSKEGDSVIGFEDSLRGINALLQTNAQPVLVCPENSPHLKHLLRNQKIAFFPSIDTINDENAPLPLK